MENPVFDNGFLSWLILWVVGPKTRILPENLEFQLLGH
jgi:hypothetical protein